MVRVEPREPEGFGALLRGAGLCGKDIPIPNGLPVLRTPNGSGLGIGVAGDTAPLNELGRVKSLATSRERSDTFAAAPASHGWSDANRSCAVGFSGPIGLS